MPSLGVGLGLPRGGAVKRFDPDALAYVANSGAASESVFEISAFVKGVKKLGLWSNMVCWPLRSSQNKGSGTTAYSLGGLGTFNGTLTNGPVWTADGITFDGSNDYIEFTNPLKSTALSAYSLFAIFDSDQSTNRAVIGSQGSSSNTTSGIALHAGGSPFSGSSPNSIYHDLTSDGINQVTTSGGNGRRYNNANTGAYQMVFAGATSIEIGLSFNTENRQTDVIASTVWNNNSTATIGSRQGAAYYFLGDIAFGLMSSSYFTPTQTADLYTLYKSTLGTGLGLP